MADLRAQTTKIQQQLGLTNTPQPEVTPERIQQNLEMVSRTPDQMKLVPDPPPPAPPVPSFGEKLTAGFEVANPVISLHKMLSEPFFPPDQNFRYMDKRDELTKGIPPAYWEELAQVESDQEAQYVRERILGELKNYELLGQGSGFTSGAALLTAAIADPTTLVAGVAEAKVLAGVLTKGARLKNAVKTGLVTAASAAAVEGVVAAGQYTTDAEDVMYAGLFGLALGAPIGALATKVDPKVLRSIDEVPASPVAQAVEGVPTPSAAPAPIPAAQVAELDEFAPIHAERQAVANSMLDSMDADLVRDFADEAPVMGFDTQPLRATMEEFSPDDFLDDVVPSAPPQDYSIGVEKFGKEWAVYAKVGDSDRILTGTFKTKKAAQAHLVESERVNAARKAEAEAAKSLAPFSVANAGPRTPKVNPDVQGADGLVLAPSRGGARIIQEANDLASSGAFIEALSGKVSRTLQKVGISDSAVLMGMKSNVAKFISYNLLESGAGVAGRTKSAALLKLGYERQLLSESMPTMREAYAAWTKQKGVHRLSAAYFGEARDQFNRELRLELEMLRNAARYGVEYGGSKNSSIRKAADAWQSMMDKALDIMQKAGVRGMDEIKRVAGYTPLKWSGKSMRRLISQEAGYKKLLSKGYQQALDIDPSDADKLSEAVWRRAVSKELGLDSNPEALLAQDSRAFLRSMLKDSGLPDQEIAALFDRIDGRMANRGKAGFARARIDIDLTVTDESGLSLLDIVDNDMQALGTRYAVESSGRAALARKGILDSSDWQELRQVALLEAGSVGDDPNKLRKILDGTYDQFLGRPIQGGVNRNARRLMNLASVTSLGQVGFAQLAEFAPILASHGIGTMLKVLPDVWKFRQAMRRGTLPDGLLGEIQVHYGRIGEEELLYRPQVRLDDKVADDPAWLRVIDNALGTAQEQMGRISLMNQIKTIQQQFVVRMQADKLAKALRSGADDKVLKRFKEMGWDQNFLGRVKSQLKHFEFDGDTLQRLNLEKWDDPELVEDFVTGLHRHTNQIVQLPLIGETSYWMHPTIGAMLTQFRTFPIVAIEKQTARAIRMLDEESFYTTMYGLGLSAMVVMGKAGINSIGKPDREKYLEERLSIGEIAKGAMHYAGTASVFPEAVNILAAAGLAPPSLAFNQIGRSGAARQLDLSAGDVPSVGAAVNIFNAASGIIKGVTNPDYDYSGKDVRALKGATPLGNTVPGTMLFNLLSSGVED